MLHFLTDYDFNFPEGFTERSAGISAETHSLPNRDATIELKGRF